MEKSVLFLLIISSISGRASVLLYDPNDVCNETNAGRSRILPGVTVFLRCEVDNTGAGVNLLVWNTPVQDGDLIHTSGALYESNSMFISTANFNGDSINATLVFTTTQAKHNHSVTCNDNLGNSKTCTLLIYTIPRNPTNLGNASITYQSVSLSWIAPSDTGGCAIINYIITVTPLDGSDPWNITTTDNSTSYIVTGLMFGQSYNFTVRANNSIGLGEESNSLTVLIPGEVPQSIHGIDMCFTIIDGNYSLNIYWNCNNISDTITPPVTSYKLGLIGSSTYIFFLDNCPSSDSPYKIPTLNNTQYCINITANNIVGPSIASKRVIRSLISITSNSKLRGETFILLRIQITWNSPCIDKVQVIISYYKSSRSSVPHNSSSSYYLIEDVSGKLFFLEDLDPGSEYLYNISIYDGKQLVIMEENKTFYTNNRDKNTIIATISPEAEPESANCVIAMGISIAITAIVTAITTVVLSSFITYYCCLKSKRSYSPSVTGPPNSGVSQFEMKDNMAYGHVTIDSGSKSTERVIYDNIVI